MAATSPEKAPLSPSNSPETKAVVVPPPKAAEAIRAFLEDLNTVKESASDVTGENWSGGGTSDGTQVSGQQGDARTSARDQAIANLPSPQVMQKNIQKHIQGEVKKLRKQAKKLSLTQPGAAHHLVQIYAKIHHLNAILGQMFEAGFDMVKRLYIRIFVDRQPII